MVVGVSTSALAIALLAGRSTYVVAPSGGDDVRTAPRSWREDPAHVMWLLRPDLPGEVAAFEVSQAHVADVVHLADHPRHDSERLNLAAQGRRLVAERNVAAVVWLEPSNDRIGLYVLDGATLAVWHRELAVQREGGDEVYAAAIGLAVASALRSLEHGAPTGMERMPAPLPTSTATVAVIERPLAAKAVHRIAVAAAYRGGYIAPEAPWGQGADLQLQWWGPRGFVAVLGLGLLAPLQGRTAVATVRVHRYPFRVGAGYRARLGHRVDLRPAAFIELDVMRRSSTASADGFTTTPTTTLLDVAAVAGVELGVAVSRRIRLFAEVRAEAWFRRRHFAVSTGEVDVVLAPAMVRPTASVGVSVLFPPLEPFPRGPRDRSH